MEFGPRFWSGLIYIILVAIFMTIFEVLFFVLYVGPEETATAKNYIKTLGNKYKIMDYQNVINEDELKLFESIDKIIKITELGEATLNVSIERENSLNSKINKDSIAFIILEIVILLLIIGLFWIMVVKSANNSKYSNLLNIEYWKTWYTSLLPSIISALIITAVLITFQISMFNFAHVFNYPKNNELIYKIINKITKDINSSS